MVPLVTTPGGKPVTAVPGLTPRSPEMTDGPVLVTVEPASTAKDVAVPKPTVDGAADACGVPTTPPKSTMAAVVPAASAPASPRRSHVLRGGVEPRWGETVNWFGVIMTVPVQTCAGRESASEVSVKQDLLLRRVHVRSPSVQMLTM